MARWLGGWVPSLKSQGEERGELALYLAAAQDKQPASAGGGPDDKVSQQVESRPGSDNPCRRGPCATSYSTSTGVLQFHKYMSYMVIFRSHLLVIRDG